MVLGNGRGYIVWCRLDGDDGGGGNEYLEKGIWGALDTGERGEDSVGISCHVLYGRSGWED